MCSPRKSNKNFLIFTFYESKQTSLTQDLKWSLNNVVRYKYIVYHRRQTDLLLCTILLLPPLKSPSKHGRWRSSLLLYSISMATHAKTIQRLSRAGPRGKAREWATLGVHPFSWLLSNNRLEEVCGTLTKGIFSSRLLLSNQDKECTPSVALSLLLPLPPSFCSTCQLCKCCQSQSCIVETCWYIYVHSKIEIKLKGSNHFWFLTSQACYSHMTSKIRDNDTTEFNMVGGCQRGLVNKIFQS